VAKSALRRDRAGVGYFACLPILWRWESGVLNQLKISKPGKFAEMSGLRPNNPRRQIVYIWPYLEWGGAQIYFAGIMKHIRNRYEVLAVMPKGSDARIQGYLQRLGVKLDFFNAHLDNVPTAALSKKIKRRFVNARCSAVIARYLSRNGFENTLLHADFGPWSSFFLLLYLSLRTNIVVTLHIAIPRLSPLRRLEWQIKFRILSLLPGFHLLVSNQDMYNSLRSYVGDKLLKTVRVAYTGVDELEIQEALSGRWDRQSICRHYNLPQNRFMVFSLGQLVQRKGYLVLLEAVRCLHAKYPNLFFVWIGEGNLRMEIERKIESAGLQGSVRVITPGEIGPERLDLLHLLRAADLFVHPSFSEGLPGALLEAMALGKASIASRVNAIPEVISDGKTGMLVPPGDHEALAGAIAALAFDSDRRNALGEAGQAIVLSQFTETITARVTAACYDACFGIDTNALMQHR
jgi:glycosyltransferase involved in cell wall biosynthesis